MRRLGILLIASTLAGLSGCRMGGGNGEVPARIVDPTAASVAELQRIISRALGGAPVSLADDVLTGESRLTIERRPHRDVQHGRVLGRDLGRAEQFRLVKQGERCVLVHVGTGERWTLTEARCVEE